ncbi:uncharacterized protein [Chironomus tepperi]|uniref:uncharacterized protein n=1 Tax=Chironomus tepperi TaxID=113505 RepID=UPI00391F866D
MLSREKMHKKLLIILSACISIGIADESYNLESKSYRLPNQTYPEYYEVQLVFPNFETTLTYSGTVIVDIKVLEDTETITLHSSVIDIREVTPLADFRDVKVNYTLDTEREFLIIRRDDGHKFKTNTNIKIRIGFLSGIEESPTHRGVYRGSYYDENSIKKYFLATHMQPTFARKVFPCYDEPRFKSKFNLSIVHRIGYHAISNMDSINSQSIPNNTVMSFEQTPLMPTYLLAFVISDFASHEVEDIESKIKFRVFSRPDQVNNTIFGEETGRHALRLFESYFNAKYELNKLDQVALPQFNYGGMENYGIVFYREDALLYEKDVTTLYDKEFAAATVVHEVCHKFIGNSLTYHWWSVLWLAEGFCRFYEYHMTHNLYPHMRLDNLFAVEAMHPVLYSDSSSTTRPLTTYVETPSEIRRMFDSISYSKAASVIRMFHYALSEETFRRGLQIYISKITSNAEGIAEPKHFYDALQQALNDSTVNVAKMYETWEFQAGYPILYVTRNYNGNNVRFSQKRFTNDIKNGTEYNELWSIPITYSSKSNPNSITPPQFWLHQKQTEVTIQGLGPNDYIIANIEQRGYYRVMYDEANWILIARELNEGNFNQIPPNTRAMLIDDAAVFMETEILDMRIFLNMIQYLKHETDYIPWMSATNNLLYIRRMLNDGSSKFYYDFQKFLQEIFTKVFETYGTQEQNNSEHHQKHIRNIAINWACQAHLPACLSQTAELFERGIRNTEVTVTTDHKSTIMCNGAISGNFTTFNFLWGLYTNSSKAADRTLYLKSIGCIENRQVLQDYIRMYSRVTGDEWFTVIQSVYLNGPIGLKVAMEFLNDDFESFDTFINNRNALTSLVSIFRGIANRVVTDEMFEAFTLLMNRYKLTNSTKESLSSIIEVNLDWIKKHSAIIDDFLNSSRTLVVSVTLIMFGFFVEYFREVHPAKKKKMLKKLLIILSVWIITVASGEIQADLLPNQTYPESYNVTLAFNNFDQNDLTFSGTVFMNVKILEDTDTITLHSSVKSISRVRKSYEVGTYIAVNYTLDIDRELLIIHESDDKIFNKDTSVVIRIEFTGQINVFPTTQGVYRGFYLDEHSIKHYFIATQMQPTYARQVFPCYDEPRFKSTFGLTIMYRPKYNAISNVDSYVDNDSFVNITALFIRTFDPTPSIPSHLLGFFISDFTFSEFEDKQDGIKFRVFSQPRQLNKTNFGFLTGIKALQSFETYINGTNVIKEVDQIVIPQLGFDGIDNQRLIYYQEDSFLYDKNIDTASKKEAVTRSIVNKNCQTIILNSIPNSWWSYLWIKGLCKFYEYHMTDSIYTEMKLSNNFALEVMQPEMMHESSSLETPSGRSSIFDSISYSKAASVIRMFHYALSEETFRRGLQIYISMSTLSPEGIAEPKHFYDALQLAVNDNRLNVTQMFESWEFQAGYPILYVTRNYNGLVVRISQKRFTNIKNGTEYNELWTIPITYSSKSNPYSHTYPQLWLQQNQSDHHIPGLKSSDYLILNIDQTGYYRVMYDESNWYAIASELNEYNVKDISPNTRAMLIDDAGIFMQMDILDIKIFLEIVKYLRLEVEYVPWMSATKSLSYIRRMLSDGNSKLYNDFQEFLQKLVTKVFETYGVQESNIYEQHHHKHVRNLAINFACQAHLPSCLSQTEDLFNKGILNSQKTISNDYKAAIMCSGVRLGNSTTYTILMDLYKNATQASERILLLKTIGCIEDYNILKEYINDYRIAIDDEWLIVLQSVYTNEPIGLKVIMNFLDSNFREFDTFINTRNALNSLVSIFEGIADRIVTQEMFGAFSTLMDRYKLTVNTKEALSTTIKKNLEWIEKNSPKIDDFLNSSRVIALSLTVILFGFFVQYFLR